jgi:pyruvate,orthophosphate dikinase
VLDHTGRDFPQDPREQLDLATLPCSTRGTPTGPSSTAGASASRTTWAPRSTCARWCSATSATTPAPGVCFTRDPPPGKAGAYGDYLVNAQGEDVVSGIRNTLSLDDFAAVDPAVARRAAPDHAAAGDALPRPVRHRVHRRARQAVDAADAGRQAAPGGGVPDRHPARRRAAHHHRRGARAGRWSAAGAADVPAVRRDAERTVLVRGMAASPVLRSGARCSTPPPAVEWAARGERSCWCARRPTPRTSKG